MTCCTACWCTSATTSLLGRCAAVDGDPVPVPHWGLTLRVDQFHELAERVRAGGISFEIAPHLRFKGARPPRSCVPVDRMSAGAPAV